MLVSDFNYDLPEERIAKFPPEERGNTRLLVLDRKTGAIKDSFYRSLDTFLESGDVLVLNDTRVIQSRLFTSLPDGRARELIVLEKHEKNLDKEANPLIIAQNTEKVNVGSVMYRGKLHKGDILTVKNVNVSHERIGELTDFKIEIIEILDGGIATVKSEVPLYELAEKFGTVPLPPYLHRDATASDKKRYQTVWAKHDGSAAAPTASLNMTNELLTRLQEKGIKICYLTLHVGLGTFLPIRTDDVENHKMHSEWFSIPQNTIESIKNAKKSQHRIVALGTTVARTLEFYAQTGKTDGEDDIFIYPGFNFQIVDALLTNFHAPKSTVLMLASAFAGWENLHQAYDYAVSKEYDFLSYGDSMLIC